MTELLTSTQVAQMLGVAPASVKRWTDAGLLRCVRTSGGHRRFTKEDVEEFRRKEAPQVEQESTPQEDVLRWLELVKTHNDTHAIAGALYQERARLGAWWKVAELLGSLLSLVGQRWSEGSLSILDEHLISERLTRGLARCAEELPSSPTAPACLLASAEGDEHTLGLSLVELCLREAGFATIWAGRRTPTSELLKRIEQGGLRLVALSASAVSDEAVLAHQAFLLSSTCAKRGCALLVGGEGQWPEPLPHAHRLHTFRELHNLLPALL